MAVFWLWNRLAFRFSTLPPLGDEAEKRQIYPCRDSLADSNTHSNSQGSNVGRASSAVTGNGAAIGGGTHGAGQTTSPGCRATEVQNLQAAEGRGRINSAKPGK